MSIVRRLLVIIAACAVGAPGALHAQTPLTPQLRGRGDIDHDRFIKAILASPDWLVITRDTVLTRGDTVRRNVLVVGATLRQDGAIIGDLVGIGANLFIRPSGTITGATHNIAGGLYKSELSTMPGTIENSPNAPYEIVRTDTELLIVGTEHPSILELSGIKGLGIPTYDRVNGVTLRVGAGVILPRVGLFEPVVRGWGTYYSHRGDFGGGGELALHHGWTDIAAGAERISLTNEGWIRGELSNSLAMLLQGKDYRNHYSADRAYVRIDRALEKGTRNTTASLVAQVEEATTFPAGRPWSILKPDSVRPNDYGMNSSGMRRQPDGRITSGIASIKTDWERPKFIAKLGGLAEVGTSALSGDHSFARYDVTGKIAMSALRTNTLGVEVHFQGPLPGTDSLPYQRWSYVGGSGTLQTFQTAAFPGDRIAFVETVYTIPLPERLALPLIGPPALDLLHAAGMGWSFGESPSFEQNVGFRLAYRIVYVRVLTNPKAFSDDVKVSLGLTLPRKTYPWSVRK